MRETKIAMARGGDRFFLFQLADRLGCPVREIEGLSLREIEEWKAYLSLEGERAENQAKLAKMKGRR